MTRDIEIQCEKERERERMIGCCDRNVVGFLEV